MRIILIAVGSAGDVHPHVGIGTALMRRGHDVSVLTNPHFEDIVRRAGLRLIPWGTAAQYDAVTQHPDLWHTRRGIEVIAGQLMQGMPDMYRLLEEEGRHGRPVLVAHSLAFAARVAHETLGLPLVTVHLQPSGFYSIDDIPVTHPWLWSINELPPRLKRALLVLIDRLSDRVFAPVANELLAMQGRPPVRSIVRQWWHSPQRVIGLFPDWLSPLRPDWPTNTALTGFPLFDDEGEQALHPDVKDFVDAGPAPIVFVPGSANRRARRFFATAAAACQSLGRRGVLLTRYPEQLPTDLPEEVRWFDYVPLGRLLPRAAALVHHGGIGTAAQGLACGCPHVIMPMTFDQPDNARRLEGLGIGRTLWPRSFHGPQLADALDELLDQPGVARRCRELADRIDPADSLARTCDLIEAAGR